MSPPNVQRHLVCPGIDCDHYHWLIDVGGNEHCPICGCPGDPVCACGCGASLVGLRSDAVYRSEACAKRLQRRGRPDTDPTAHPLDAARGRVEEGPTAAQWALIAREHAMRTLLETGYFTADDLAVLNLPEHYRRSVHGLVTAFFRGPKPYMEEAGRRKSERPERKGAKNTIFRISAKGRRELPKLLTDTRQEIASAGVSADVQHGDAQEDALSAFSSSRVGTDSGHSQPGEDAPLPASSPGAVPEQLQEGRDRQVMGAGSATREGSSAEPRIDGRPSVARRTTQPASRPEDQSEALSLLPEPPNFTDPDQRRAA